MSLSKSSVPDQGTVPMDLSMAAQSSSESHATASASSTSQSSVISIHQTGTSLQGPATYGICMANSAVTVAGSLPQTLANQISSTGCQNLQVARSAVPLVSASIGANQVVYPGMRHPAFPQAIPISSALIGQPITIQRLANKGQPLALGSVTHISGQRIIHQGSSSPGKAISPRPIAQTNSLQRPVISNFSTAQHFQKSSTPTLVSVSQAQQIGIRVPSATGQQVAIQRTVSPLVAQQVSVANQSSFIQCLPNATVVSQQIAQSSPNIRPLQTAQQVATSPLGAATIVGPASHMGTTAFVTGQPISIQPRPPVAYIASAPPTGMTLTVTSIAPGQTSLQTSSSTTSSQATLPNQQILWPGSSISQGQVIRTGIPLVLPRGTIAFAGRPQLIQSSAVPRLIQKPMVSLSANCGGQVTVQVPQVISPVIKTVLQGQPPPVMPSKDSELLQATGTSQANPGVIFTAVLVPTTNVISSSLAPITTLAVTAPSNKVLEVGSNQITQCGGLLENNTATVESIAYIPATSVTTVTTTSTLAAIPTTSLLTTTAASSPGDGGNGEVRISSGFLAVDTENITCSTTTTTASISTGTNQTQSLIADQDPSYVQNSKMVTCPSKESMPYNQNQNEGSLEKTSPDKMPSSLCTLTTSDTSALSVTMATTKVPTVTTPSSNISVLSLPGSQFGITNHSEDQQKHSLVVESSNKDGGDNNNEGVVLTEGFIDSNLLEWSDGVGKLPGTDMKFKINEFGDLELIDESGSNVEVRLNNKSGETKPDNHVLEDSSGDHGKDRRAKDCSVSDPAELSEHEGDPVCCCVYCGRYGYKSNFKTSGRFCSQSCAGKRKLQRKQLMMSQMMMGMKKKKKTLILSGEMNTISQEQQNGQGPMSEKRLLSFDWESYLEETKSVAAPKRLFREPFPASRNGFRLGMRLEGIDPKHQSLFCVLSVAEIQGYRLRLHFDGYSECYDFWVNADSPFIFPVGWAEKNGKTLQPPKNIPVGEFNWTSYLKQTRAVAAPKHLFINQPSSVVPSAFRVGMKLEAVDKKNSSLICVATVADSLGDRILVHFDGWEDTYDYWCDIASPSIRPVGWCQTNGHTLSSPPDYGDNFTWNNYLQETHSTAVPARAFKTRAPMGFEKGMKVEVTDKRNPILIRVATIADVQDNRLLIHFDGWDSIYDYWIDDDSSELHPPTWCSKTFHPLQGPIDKKSLKHVADSGGCPTIGCNGIGHIKGAKYTGHHSAFGCPYSEVNMSKDSALTDRLGSSRSEEGSGVPLRHDGTVDMRKCPTPGCDGLGHVTGKFTSHHCLSGCPLAEKNLAKIKQEVVPEPRPVGRPGRGRKRKLYSLSQSPPPDKMIKTEVTEEVSEDRSAFHASIHESVFQSMAPSLSMMDQPLCWEQHAKLLPGVADVNQTLVSNWTVDEVADFVLKLTGNEEQAQRFREEQVDGDSFLLLQQSDLLNFLNIKLGPAIKIFNSILVFRAASEAY